MKNLIKLSPEMLENELWHLGLNSHNFISTERKSYIYFLKTFHTQLNPKTILNAISYVMHTYFASMTDTERADCIDILLEIKIRKLQNYGDIFDMLGILFKMAPKEKKRIILNYILKNGPLCLKNPSALISLCNSFSYIFDELSYFNKCRIIKKLTFIIDKNMYSHLQDTLLFTLNLFTKDIEK